MSRPTHTKTGRKISDELTDTQAQFAEWLSGEGQALIGDASIAEAQRISIMLEAAFIAGYESRDVKEIRAEAGRAGFVACWHDHQFMYILPERLEYRANQYAATVRQGGAE